MKLSPDVLEADAVPQGKCQKVKVKAKGLPMRPMRYVVLRCPTGVGYTEQLLESGDFSAHNVEWTLKPTADGGTIVTVKARTRLKREDAWAFVLSGPLYMTVRAGWRR